MTFHTELDYHLQQLCKKLGIKKLSYDEATRASHLGVICSLMIFDDKKYRFPYILIEMAFPSQYFEKKALFYTVSETDGKYFVCFVLYNTQF